MPEVSSTADTPIPWVLTLVKGNLGVSSGQENLTSVGFEPTTSGIDLPMFYRLSYEATASTAPVKYGSRSG